MNSATPYKHKVQTWPVLYRFSILFVNYLLTNMMCKQVLSCTHTSDHFVNSLLTNVKDKHDLSCTYASILFVNSLLTNMNYKHDLSCTCSSILFVLCLQSWNSNILFVNFLLLVVPIFFFSFPALCLLVLGYLSLHSSFTAERFSLRGRTHSSKTEILWEGKVSFTCLVLPPSHRLLTAGGVDSLLPYFTI